MVEFDINRDTICFYLFAQLSHVNYTLAYTRSQSNYIIKFVRPFVLINPIAANQYEWLPISNRIFSLFLFVVEERKKSRNHDARTVKVLR